MRRAGFQMPTCTSCFLCIMAIQAMFQVSLASLKVGYYKHKCPSAENIVRQTVREAMIHNPGIGAGLIRMHFHDCFVRGCDASVLLDSTPGNPSEKESPANNPSLRGFEVIDEAKARIESACPSTVSCADILTFASRDAAYFAGGIKYAVPAGRRDGRVSIESEVLSNVPPFFFNAVQLANSFAQKGLSLDEMVALSGAHSFGVSHCSSFADRLNATGRQDAKMDRKFATFLRSKCSRAGSDPTVNLDVVTPNRLDYQYYKNLQKGRGLLTSDQTLHTSALTSRLVDANAKRPRAWAANFAAAMVKMGSVEVLTGDQGEIRRTCRVVNKY
ncbi:peroxidase 5 [Cocos nucifera]|nr:peroxidase 5 [Cocos nucifera]